MSKSIMDLSKSNSLEAMTTKKSKTTVGLVKEMKTGEPHMVDAGFVKLCNDFSFRILTALTADQENATCSPFSLMVALGLTLCGARGSTTAEILSILGLPAGDDVQTELHQNIARLLDCYLFMLSYSGRYEISIVNKLLKNKLHHPSAEFEQQLKKYYGTGVEEFDFCSPTAVEDVNAWIKVQSNGKIDHIVEKFHESMKMVLINTFFFKAKLSEFFDAKLTKMGVFFNKGDTDNPVEVTMMSAEKVRVKYSERTVGGQPSQVVEIPCRGGINIVFVLPRESRQLNLMWRDPKVRTQAIKDIRGFYKKINEQYVDITIPRFDISSFRDAADLFKEIGLKEMFDSTRANFSGIDGEERLFLSQILHRTRIDFTEDGSSPSPKDTIMHFVPKFTANRPFLFTVRETLNGITLACGSVVEFK